MKVLCIFTRYNYGDPARGTSIDYASFVPALESMGHEVRHFDSWDRTFVTYAAMNRAMIEIVEAWHPDLVFTVQRDYEIFLETLQAIAQRGVALVTWTTDDSFKFKHYSRFIAPFYDVTSTTYDYRLKDYAQAGIEGVVLTQWAANAFWLQEPLPAAQCKYQVSFIGTRYGDRQEMADRLQAAGISFSPFGFGWPSGPVETEEIPRIMRDSVISLNFSAAFKVVEGHTMQLKARTFEVPGAGGFLLSDRAPGIEQCYLIGQEVDVFDSIGDLQEKIKFYLAHPELRDRMAQAAFARTRDEHLYAIRLRPILDLAMSRAASRVARTSGTAPVVSLSDAAFQEPRVGLVSRALRAVLVQICGAVWGPERGLKAARRLCFEASVRLLGRRTFTYKSLPATLFPYR